MELSFAMPLSNGEWLAFASAAVTALLGAFLMFAPNLALRFLRLQTKPDRPEAIAEVRSRLAGFYLGLGLCCLLLAQPFLYMALGFCWILAAFGRIVSMMSDRANTPYNWAWTVIEILLAVPPLGFALGVLP